MTRNVAGATAVTGGAESPSQAAGTMTAIAARPLATGMASRGTSEIGAASAAAMTIAVAAQTPGGYAYRPKNAKAVAIRRSHPIPSAAAVTVGVLASATGPLGSTPAATIVPAARIAPASSDTTGRCAQSSTAPTASAPPALGRAGQPRARTTPPAAPPIPMTSIPT